MNHNIAKFEMSKPSAFLNPVPLVMVSCGSMEKANIITLAWAGTINSNPPMLSVSVRKERHSYGIIKESGIFAVNLVSRALVKAADYCGVKSGRDVDKFRELNLSKTEGSFAPIPMIGESPVNIECVVRQVVELGSHDMFISEIKKVHVAERLMDQNGNIDLAKAELAAYSHGEYFQLGEWLGFFGFSVANPDILARRSRHR